LPARNALDRDFRRGGFQLLHVHEKRSALTDFLVSLTYPLTLSLWLIPCGILAWAMRRRALGGALLATAIGWSLLWSVPQVSDWLRAPLERQHAVVEAAALPKADAIIVLGGGKVRPDQVMSSRLAAAAHAWAAGRAGTIILSGGGGRNGKRRGRTEADRMANAIASFGVPASALVLEDRSKNTEQNALFTARLARERDIHRVLLVTSSLHMPRASLLFREAGLDVIPVAVPEGSVESGWADRWLPSRRALWRSGRALKEYAGLLALHAGVE
jgi:uncharacterized SAM-binding protein YcdF (DUF218 family)